MVRVLQVAWHPRHHPAGPKKRKVEAAAVVGRQALGLPKLLLEERQESSLSRRVGEEELGQLEACGNRPAESHREDLGARAAGESSRLGVEVGVGDLRLRARHAAWRQNVGVPPGHPVGRLDGFEASWHDALHLFPAVLRREGGGCAASQTGKAVAESSLRQDCLAPSTPLSGPIHEGQPAMHGHSRTSSEASASRDVCSS